MKTRDFHKALAKGAVKVTLKSHPNVDFKWIIRNIDGCKMEVLGVIYNGKLYKKNFITTICYKSQGPELMHITGDYLKIIDFCEVNEAEVLI